MGDQEREGLALFLKDAPPDSCDVLVLPHHGGDATVVRELLTIVPAKTAVASARRPTGRAVRALTDEKGIPLCSTQEKGTITIEICNDRLVTRPAVR